MKCIDCKEKSCTKNNLATVDKVFHELSLAKEKQRTNNWKLATVAALMLCVLTNLYWIFDRQKFEKVTETTTTETYTFEGIEQNSEGNNYIVGGDINGNTKD